MSSLDQLQVCLACVSQEGRSVAIKKGNEAFETKWSEGACTVAEMLPAFTRICAIMGAEVTLTSYQFASLMMIMTRRKDAWTRLGGITGIV